MANGIVIPIQAQLTGYEESIAGFKRALQKVDPGSIIGKSLTKQLEQAEKLYREMAKNPAPMARSYGDVENIIGKTRDMDALLQQIGQGFSGIDSAQIKMDSVPGIKELISDLQTARALASQEIKTSFMNDIVSQTQELSGLLQNLGLDLAKANPEDMVKGFTTALGQIQKEADTTEKSLKDLTQRRDKAQGRANRTQNRIDTRNALLDKVLVGPGVQRGYTPENAQAVIERLLRTGTLTSEGKVVPGTLLTAPWSDKGPMNTFFALDKIGTEQEFMAQLYAYLNSSSMHREKRFFPAFAGRIGFNGQTNQFDTNSAEYQAMMAALQGASIVTPESQQEYEKVISQFYGTLTQEDSRRLAHLYAEQGMSDKTRAEFQKVTGSANAQDLGRVSQALEQVRQLNAERNTLSQQLQESRTRIDTLTTELETVKSQLATLQETKNAPVAAKEQAIENARRKVAEDTRKQGQTIADRAYAAQLPADAAAKYEAALDRISSKQRALGKFEGIVQRWFSAYAVIRMVGKAIRDITKTVTELDKTITQISIVTSMSSSDLWGQMSQYTQMAQQYAASISGVYEVSQLFYQQGLQQADVMVLTEETLKLAQISGLGYSEATNYMTNALRSFKMEMQEAATVTDVYAALAASSASSVKELATAMSKTASSAEAVGTSFQETSAMMAVMIEATREAPENIGSAMKSIISRYGELTKSPDEILNIEGEEISLNRVDKALQTVGISIHDQEGQFRGFGEVIMELSKKWNTLDSNTQRYIATIMAGNRQQSRFLALVSSGERYEQELDIAQNAEDTGTLQQLKTMDSVAAKAQQAKTALESIYTSAGLEKFLKTWYTIEKNIANTVARISSGPSGLLGVIAKVGTTFWTTAKLITTIFKTISASWALEQRKMTLEQDMAAKERAVRARGESVEQDEAYQELAAKYAILQERMSGAHMRGTATRTSLTVTGNNATRFQGFQQWGATRAGQGTGMALMALGLGAQMYAASIDENGNHGQDRAKKGWANILGGAASGFGMGLAMSGGNPIVAGIMAAVTALPSVIEGIQQLMPESIEKRVERLQSEETEQQNKSKEATAEARTLSADMVTLERLRAAQYDSLESRQEFIDKSNELAEKYPEMASTYDNEGNAIIRLSDAYALLAEKMREASEEGIKASSASLERAKAQRDQAERTYKTTLQGNQNLIQTEVEYTLQEDAIQAEGLEGWTSDDTEQLTNFLFELENAVAEGVTNVMEIQVPTSQSVRQLLISQEILDNQSQVSQGWFDEFSQQYATYLAEFYQGINNLTRGQANTQNIPQLFTEQLLTNADSLFWGYETPLFRRATNQLQYDRQNTPRYFVENNGQLTFNPHGYTDNKSNMELAYQWILENESNYTEGPVYDLIRAIKASNIYKTYATKVRGDKTVETTEFQGILTNVNQEIQGYQTIKKLGGNFLSNEQEWLLGFAEDATDLAGIYAAYYQSGFKNQTGKTYEEWRTANAEIYNLTEFQKLFTDENTSPITTLLANRQQMGLDWVNTQLSSITVAQDNKLYETLKTYLEHLYTGVEYDTNAQTFSVKDYNSAYQLSDFKKSFNRIATIEDGLKMAFKPDDITKAYNTLSEERRDQLIATANNIVDAFEAGQITFDNAQNSINQLLTLASSLSIENFHNSAEEYDRFMNLLFSDTAYSDYDTWKSDLESYAREKKINLDTLPDVQNYINLMGDLPRNVASIAMQAQDKVSTLFEDMNSWFSKLAKGMDIKDTLKFVEKIQGLKLSNFAMNNQGKFILTDEGWNKTLDYLYSELETSLTALQEVSTKMLEIDDTMINSVTSEVGEGLNGVSFGTTEYQQAWEGIIEGVGKSDDRYDQLSTFLEQTGMSLATFRSYYDRFFSSQELRIQYKDDFAQYMQDELGVAYEETSNIIAGGFRSMIVQGTKGAQRLKLLMQDKMKRSGNKYNITDAFFNAAIAAIEKGEGLFELDRDELMALLGITEADLAEYHKDFASAMKSLGSTFSEIYKTGESQYIEYTNEVKTAFQAAGITKFDGTALGAQIRLTYADIEGINEEHLRIMLASQSDAAIQEIINMKRTRWQPQALLNATKDLEAISTEQASALIESGIFSANVSTIKAAEQAGLLVFNTFTGLYEITQAGYTQLEASLKNVADPKTYNKIWKQMQESKYGDNVAKNLENFLKEPQNIGYDEVSALASSLGMTATELIAKYHLQLDKITGNYRLAGQQSIDEIENTITEQYSDRRERNAALALLYEAAPEVQSNKIWSDVAKNYNSISAELLAQWADETGLRIEELKALLIDNKNGTYAIKNLRQFRQFLQEKYGNNIPQDVRNSYEEIVSAYESSFKDFIGTTAGTTDLSAMRKQVNALNQSGLFLRTTFTLTGEETGLFEWSDIVHGYVLSMTGFLAQLRLMRHQLGDEAGQLDEATSQIVKENLRQFAENIDISGYISSNRTDADFEKYLKEPLQNYNRYLVALEGLRSTDADLRKLTTISPDKAKAILDQGGAAAVTLAETIAKISDEELDPEETAKIYRSNTNRLIDTVSKNINLSVGAVIDNYTADILGDAYSFEAVGDNLKVVTGINNLGKAYERYLNALSDSIGVTISEINAAAADYFTYKNGDQQTILDTLSSGASLTYTAFGELLASFNIKMTEDFMNVLENQQIIQSLGGDKMAILNWSELARALKIDPTMPGYTSAFSTYNDGLIKLNRDVEKNITAQIKQISSTKPGEQVNLTYLWQEGLATIDESVAAIEAERLQTLATVSGDGEYAITAANRDYDRRIRELKQDNPFLTLQNELEQVGAQFKDGILSFSSNANIPKALQLISNYAADYADLTAQELHDLSQAITDALSSYVTAIQNGLNGTLSQSDAFNLQQFAGSYGINLSFTQATEGLRLSTQQAGLLYVKIREIDEESGRIAYNNLVNNIKEANSGLATSGGLMAKIETTSAQIASLQAEIANGTRQGTAAEQTRLAVLQAELDAYEQMARQRLTDSKSFDWKQELPGGVSAAQNMYASVFEMQDTVRNAFKQSGEKKGAVTLEEFHNMLAYYQNLADETDSFSIAGMRFEKGMNSAQQYFEMGINKAFTIQGESGLYIDLSNLAPEINFDQGNYSLDDISSQIQSFAAGQVEMLDEVINVLEIAAEMEKIGDIDTDASGSIDLTEIFPDFNIGDQTAIYSDTLKASAQHWLDLANQETEAGKSFKAWAQAQRIRVNDQEVSYYDLWQQATSGQPIAEQYFAAHQQMWEALNTYGQQTYERGNLDQNYEATIEAKRKINWRIIDEYGNLHVIVNGKERQVNSINQLANALDTDALDMADRYYQVVTDSAAKTYIYDPATWEAYAAVTGVVTIDQNDQVRIKIGSTEYDKPADEAQWNTMLAASYFDDQLSWLKGESDNRKFTYNPTKKRGTYTITEDLSMIISFNAETNKPIYQLGNSEVADTPEQALQNYYERSELLKTAGYTADTDIPWQINAHLIPRYDFTESKFKSLPKEIQQKIREELDGDLISETAKTWGFNVNDKGELTVGGKVLNEQQINGIIELPAEEKITNASVVMTTAGQTMLTAGQMMLAAAALNSEKGVNGTNTTDQNLTLGYGFSKGLVTESQIIDWQEFTSTLRDIQPDLGLTDAELYQLYTNANLPDWHNSLKRNDLFGWLTTTIAQMRSSSPTTQDTQLTPEATEGTETTEETPTRGAQETPDTTGVEAGEGGEGSQSVTFADVVGAADSVTDTVENNGTNTVSAVENVETEVAQSAGQAAEEVVAALNDQRDGESNESSDNTEGSNNANESAAESANVVISEGKISEGATAQPVKEPAETSQIDFGAILTDYRDHKYQRRRADYFDAKLMSDGWRALFDQYSAIKQYSSTHILSQNEAAYTGQLYDWLVNNGMPYSQDVAQTQWAQYVTSKRTYPEDEEHIQAAPTEPIQDSEATPSDYVFSPETLRKYGLLSDGNSFKPVSDFNGIINSPIMTEDLQEYEASHTETPFTATEGEDKEYLDILSDNIVSAFQAAGVTKALDPDVRAAILQAPEYFKNEEGDNSAQLDVAGYERILSLLFDRDYIEQDDDYQTLNHILDNLQITYPEQYKQSSEINIDLADIKAALKTPNIASSSKEEIDTTGFSDASAKIQSISNVAGTAGDGFMTAAENAQNASAKAANAFTGMTGSMDITAKVKFEKIGDSGGTIAGVTGNVDHFGTAFAKGTLMGELGPELVVSGGRYFLAGENGAEFVDLDKDAIVFNHLQTKRLLNSGSSGRGNPITNEKNATSYAKGNVRGPAMAGASAALAELRKIRSMWAKLADMGLSDLAKKGGGGGGGGGGGDIGSYLADLERWYTLMQKIAALEKDINYEEKLRTKIQSDRESNGIGYYESQKRSLDAIREEVVHQQELNSLQEKYLEQRVADLQDSFFSNFIAFDEKYGVMTFNESREKFGDGTQKGFSALANELYATDKYGKPKYNAKEQLNLLKSWGLDMRWIEYDESGKKIDMSKDEGAEQAIKNFDSLLNARKDEIQELTDSLNDGKEKVLDLADSRNKLLQEFIDNQLDLEQKLLKAEEARRQAEIDAAQDERDALEKSQQKFLDGLNQSLEKERQMYETDEGNAELNRLRRQLAILQRSGGSASEIRSLQDEIREKDRDLYFDSQQNQIDAIQDAADKQLERLDRQIELLTEALDYDKEHGRLWEQVYDIMTHSTPQEILNYITQNTPDYMSNSELQNAEDTRKIFFSIQQWSEYMKDQQAEQETDYHWNTYWESVVAEHNGIEDDTELKDKMRQAYMKKYTTNRDDPNAAAAEANKLLAEKYPNTIDKNETVYGDDSKTSSNGGGTGGNAKTGKVCIAYIGTDLNGNRYKILKTTTLTKAAGTTVDFVKDKLQQTFKDYTFNNVTPQSVVIAQGITKQINAYYFYVGKEALGKADTQVLKDIANYEERAKANNSTTAATTKTTTNVNADNGKKTTETTNKTPTQLLATNGKPVWSVKGERVSADSAQAAIAEYMRRHSLKDNKGLTATPVMKSYSSGGLADYTGLAMVHGSPSRPEAFLNAEETRMWKEQILSSGGRGSLANLLLDFRSSIAGMADKSTYSTIGSNSNIGDITVNMNVASISNDYDVRQAAETAMDEIVKIARRTTSVQVRR